jgi:hypothetical protein
MTNLKKLEKSKGVVVFAFNSTTVDYVSIADQTSRLIDANLKLPVTLITDNNADPKFKYDTVIKVDSQSGNLRNSSTGELVEWRNFDRYLAYKLSPYDTTILLDCDYLVFDDSLLNLLDQDFDYRLMHNSHRPKDEMYQIMGTLGLPFVWATVVLFKKSKLSKQYFDLVGRIQQNYFYYSILFNCMGSYRNDHAFAMANLILNGYDISEHKSIPWSMLTVDQSIESLEIKNNFVILRHNDSADVVAKQNIHVMDKKFLSSNDFKYFVDRMCNEST